VLIDKGTETRAHLRCRLLVGHDQSNAHQHSAGRSPSAQDLEGVNQIDRLTRDRAAGGQFYERRGKLAAAKAPPVQEAEQPPAIAAGLASAEAPWNCQ
jgi:hypothetical protein